MRRSYELDMCSGPLLSRIIIFALPLMLSGILQLLFNAADIIVVGRFTGSEALAAVGSTSSLINLLVNLFLGISVGGNVLMARYCGARDERNARETVHTAICISIIGGILMIFIGNLLARPLLEWMGTPADVIDLSVVYMRIYFIGMPAFITYDFGAALLRAVGDTRRPLYFLFAAGVINVIFNLIFVIVFHLGVAGVALATIISQTISALLVLICLIRSDGVLHLCKGELRIHPDKVKGMLRIGLPAGIQGCIFNISNRADPVFSELVRIAGDGRQYRRQQHRRLCLYFHERGVSDFAELYRTEHGCTQLSASGSDLVYVSGRGRCRWHRIGRGRGVVRHTIAWHLYQ